LFSDFFFAALTMMRFLERGAADRTAALDARFARWSFGADALLPLLALTGDLGDAATRVGLERLALVFAAAGLRLAALAVVVLTAGFFVKRAGLLILAETLASLLLPAETDLDDRLIAFAGRLDDFFGAFLRVDMADLLLKSSVGHAISSRPSRRVHSRPAPVIHIAADPDRDRAD